MSAERRAFNAMFSIESGPRPGRSDKDDLGGHWLPPRPPGNWNKLVLSAWEPASRASLTSVCSLGCWSHKDRASSQCHPGNSSPRGNPCYQPGRNKGLLTRHLCPSSWPSDYWNDELREARIFSRNLLLGEGKGWSLAPDSGKKSLPRKEIFLTVFITQFQ